MAVHPLCSDALRLFTLHPYKARQLVIFIVNALQANNYALFGNVLVEIAISCGFQTFLVARLSFSELLPFIIGCCLYGDLRRFLCRAGGREAGGGAWSGAGDPLDGHA